jgi:hypothetical protein
VRCSTNLVLEENLVSAPQNAAGIDERILKYKPHFKLFGITGVVRPTAGLRCGRGGATVHTQNTISYHIH